VKHAGAALSAPLETGAKTPPGYGILVRSPFHLI
jgi:hypothetical protein